MVDFELARAGLRLARVCERHITSIVGERPRDVALLLSGGIDSTLVGLAAHELGHRVHAYTFRLGEIDSFDSKWAQKTARHMGWEWTPVELPTGVGSLVKSWPRLYHELHCRKKREFECTWPFLWVYPAIDERYVLNGLNVDAYFALGRKSFKSGASGPDSNREVFDAARRGYCLKIAKHGTGVITPEFNPSCMYQHLKLQRLNGLTDVNPFLCREAYKFFMQYSWQELNVPKQKQHLRMAYPMHIGAVGARNHQNYQLAGKIDKHFELVLDTPINYMKRGRTLDMFSDWWRETPERVRQREAVIKCIQRDVDRARDLG